MNGRARRGACGYLNANHKQTHKERKKQTNKHTNKQTNTHTKDSRLAEALLAGGCLGRLVGPALGEQLLPPPQPRQPGRRML